MTYPDCENDNESVVSSDVRSDHGEIKLDELAYEGNITELDEHGVVAPVDDAIAPHVCDAHHATNTTLNSL